MAKQKPSESQKALFPENQMMSDPETGRDKKIERLIDKSFDLDLLEMITDLTKSEVRAFVKARTFADVFDVPLVKDVVNDYMLLFVSKGRKGREELTSLVRSFADDSGKPGGPLQSLFNGTDD